MKAVTRANFPPRMMALSQAQNVATQNTWYTILPETKDCRIIGIIMNMAVANEDLECRVTIDGEEISGVQANAVAGTNYTALLAQTYIAQSLSFTATVYVGRGHLFEGRLVKVEIRKTSNNGVGNVLGGSVMYQQY